MSSDRIHAAWGASFETGLSLMKLFEAVRRMGHKKPLVLWVDANQAADLAHQVALYHEVKWHNGRVSRILDITIMLSPLPKEGNHRICLMQCGSADKEVEIECAE